MKNPQRFIGHLCQMEFREHKITRKGFILRIDRGDKSTWALFLTENKKLIEPLITRTLISSEDIAACGVEFIPFGKKDIVADGPQKPADPSFGHFINTFTYKFEGGKDKTTEWLKKA